jgi:hypothetical protein
MKEARRRYSSDLLCMNENKQKANGDKQEDATEVTCKKPNACKYVNRQQGQEVSNYAHEQAHYAL